MTHSPPEDLIPLTIERFWEIIPPLWGEVKKHVRGTATGQFGISEEQFHILRHVRRGIGSASELAQVKQISRSAISQALDALVEKGLLTRCQESDDRRFVRLELTPLGNDMLNAIFVQNRSWMAEKLQSLTPVELRQVIQALELLKTTFSPDDL
jgi:MarR family transcriptional regulator, 2-MHQ and catechol-resistance regulon repressor